MTSQYCQLSCSDLTIMEGYQDSSRSNDHEGAFPTTNFTNCLFYGHLRRRMILKWAPLCQNYRQSSQYDHLDSFGVYCSEKHHFWKWDVLKSNQSCFFLVICCELSNCFHSYHTIHIFENQRQMGTPFRSIWATPMPLFGHFTTAKAENNANECNWSIGSIS